MCQSTTTIAALGAAMSGWQYSTIWTSMIAADSAMISPHRSCAMMAGILATSTWSRHEAPDRAAAQARRHLHVDRPPAEWLICHQPIYLRVGVQPRGRLPVVQRSRGGQVDERDQ